MRPNVTGATRRRDAAGRPAPAPHPRARTVTGVLHTVATWWDGVELWLTQLDFTLQVLLVVGVLGPLCWGIAATVDSVGGHRHPRRVDGARDLPQGALSAAGGQRTTPARIASTTMRARSPVPSFR